MENIVNVNLEFAIFLYPKNEARAYSTDIGSHGGALVMILIASKLFRNFILSKVEYPSF
jgi:hypothetical protein